MKRSAASHAWPKSSGARRRRIDGGVEIVGAEQDERVRAAQLENDLLQVAPGDLGDGRARAPEPVSETPRTRGSAITVSIYPFVA